MSNERIQTSPRATRVQKGKSRQGCLKCKARHVKCDELRPSCGNCSRIDFPCPGYERLLRWSGKHERLRAKLSPSPRSTRRVVAGLEESVPFDIHADILVVDTQGEAQAKDLIQDAERVRQGSGARTKACVLSPVATAVTSTGVEQHTAWNIWNSIDVSDSSNESMGILAHMPADVVTSEQTSKEVVAPGLSSSPMGTPRYTITPNPIDIPTTLIEYWFNHVCQMWSTFDSDVNYNRQIATVNCTTSEVCFFALQSMSAAYLVELMPDLKDSLASIISQTSTLVRQRILALEHSLEAKASDVDIDLVFAVFALGTSLHWTEHSRRRDSLLVSARLLLRRWQLTCGDLQPELYAYFRQALVYWEMLLSVTGTGCDHEELSRRRERHRMQPYQVTKQANSSPFDGLYKLSPFEAPGSFLGSRPNSWCGVSSEVVDIFGQVLTLYRNACERQSDGGLTTNSAICDAIYDLEIAHELQHELLAMNFNSTIETDEMQGFSLYTGDDNTPLAHHVDSAEAYRLASLLQLYLAFTDLEAQSWGELPNLAPERVLEDGDAVTVQISRTGNLLCLTSQLLRVLERISPWSGSRRMQPMLYISAAAGLRHDSSSTSDISMMRKVVLTQLGVLQQILPTRPLGKAIDLVKAIWTAYDVDASGTQKIHWPEVMVNRGLQTMFG